MRRLHFKRSIAAMSALILGACTVAPAGVAQETSAHPGALVIAGGGLKADTDDVWTAFVAAARNTGPVVVISSASASPAESAASATQTLVRYGIASTRIELAELALVDDPSTEHTDESTWATNAADPSTIALLESAAAFWFTGGDQSRTTQILLNAAGEPTPALLAIRRASKMGAPIGGTSAGAAVMSDPMITQGETITALTGSDNGEPLGTAPGLGFFSHGLVDQHFGERARLGRLAAALMSISEKEARIGFGVDENTALIFDGLSTLSVAGTGYVTVVDGRQAQFTLRDSGALQVTGLSLHLISAGDKLDLTTTAIKPADWKSPTVGQEYVDKAQPGGGGMAIAGQGLQSVLGEGLIDNAQATTVERISFDQTGRGIAYMFTQERESLGFWGRGPDGAGRYAIANIRFDILPVKVSVETEK